MLKESVFQEWCFFLWTRLVLLVHFSRVAAVGESPGPARFRFPAIVRAVGYMVHLLSSLSRRFEFFFFFPGRACQKRHGLRVAPELERIAVAAHACCLAPIAPTNLAILPLAENSRGLVDGVGRDRSPAWGRDASPRAERPSGVASAAAVSRSASVATSVSRRSSPLASLTNRGPSLSTNTKSVCALEYASSAVRVLPMSSSTAPDRPSASAASYARSIASGSFAEPSTPTPLTAAAARSARVSAALKAFLIRSAVLTARSRSLRRRSGVFDEFFFCEPRGSGSVIVEPPPDCDEEEDRLGIHGGDPDELPDDALAGRDAQSPPPPPPDDRDESDMSDSRTFRESPPPPPGLHAYAASASAASFATACASLYPSLSAVNDTSDTESASSRLPLSQRSMATSLRTVAARSSTETRCAGVAKRFSPGAAAAAAAATRASAIAAAASFSDGDCDGRGSASNRPEPPAPDRALETLDDGLDGDARAEPGAPDDPGPKPLNPESPPGGECRTSVGPA
mmetsp:Transcript_6022/g.23174  ORF Transcript_6022/g.23174 Transcript_6022/m.23174 type:complete len:512 (-) Transcript_6022:889-2424(-)